MSRRTTRPGSTRDACRERLAACAHDLAALPVIARTLAYAGVESPVLVHFTFDDPVAEHAGWQTLMTYHLADASEYHDPGTRNEVRGCCHVRYAPGRPLALSDADAEAFIVAGEPHCTGQPPPTFRGD